MGKIISIGWDVGGWHGRKNALSVIVFENGSLKLTVPPKCIKRDLLFDNGEGLPTFILNEIAPNDRLVIAIDSPFGFPEAFSRLITDVNYVFNDVGDDFYKNLYAFRKTDINIIDKLGKKPISPSFDKLTNNVSLTINLLRILKENNFAIAPWDAIVIREFLNAKKKES